MTADEPVSTFLTSETKSRESLQRDVDALLAHARARCEGPFTLMVSPSLYNKLKSLGVNTQGIDVIRAVRV